MPSKQEAFLTAWEPWQKHLRHQAVTAFDWQTLPLKRVAFRAAEEPQCVITQESLGKLQQPLCFGQGNTLRVYECDAFLTWWQAHGTEPLSQQPVTLDALYRPR